MNQSEPGIPRFITDKIADIVALCVRHGVRRMDVFGSATTDQFDPVISDIDLLISYKEGVDPGPWMEEHLALKSELEDLLGRDVDLVFDSPRRNPIFNRNVMATRRLIYEAQE